VGGAEESTVALARALSERGHDVVLVAPRLGDETPEGVELATVEVGLAGSGPYRASVYDRPRVQLRIGREVARLARGADVVHVQSLPLLPAGYGGARAARAAVVATIRDVAGICPISVSLLYAPRVPPDCGIAKLERTCIPQFRALYGGRSRARMSATVGVRFLAVRGRSRLLNRCERVVAVGSDLGPLYQSAGLIRRRVDVLPNIVEFEGASPDGRSRDYALYAGKVSHGKGIAYLLEALGLARRLEPEFRLLVAGAADERWLARLRAADGLEFLGRVDRGRLPELYAGARLAVVASIWPEPLPRAALEASLCEVPVVATRAGGISDAVADGETGLLVPPRDSAALADALLRVWRDPALGRTLGEAGRRRIEERFSRDVVAQRAEELYGDALRARS
jgi:glycosyltransferase involved in cell wall biosynthesis